MGTFKLTAIAVAGCLWVGLAPGSANAGLAEVIADYCDEVAQNVDNTQSELENASEDLAECDNELDRCFRGAGLFDEPSDCIRDYAQCTKRGKRDQKQACSTFLREFRGDTNRAERKADREDVEDEFLDWFNSDIDQRNACIVPAQVIAAICTDELLGDD